MIDYAFNRQDYPGAMQAIEDLDKLVKKDPFLDYYRGLLYKMMDSTAAYMRQIEKAHQYNPKFRPLALELIAAYNANGQSDKAQPLIESYRKHADWNQGELDIVLGTTN